MASDRTQGAKEAAEDFPENKLAKRAFVKLAKNAFGLIPGSGARLDEHRDGYTQKHQLMANDVGRVVHVTTDSGSTSPTSSSTISSTGASTMSSATSAEEQIQLLEDLKSYLNNFQEKLIGVSANYRRKADSLDGSLLREVHQQFVETEVDPACELIVKLADMIADSSIPAVERRIQQLEHIVSNG